MKRLVIIIVLLCGFVGGAGSGLAQGNGNPTAKGDDPQLLQKWSLFLEYAKINDGVEALKYGWQILESHPARFKTLHRRMMKIYSGFLDANPESPLRDGWRDSLLIVVDNAIKTFPDRAPQYWLRKGYYLEAYFDGKEEEALKAYENGVGENYEAADPYYLLRMAILYAKFKDNNPEYESRLISVSRAILKKDPNNETAQSLLKSAITDPDQYIAVLRDAYQADPDNVQKLYDLAVSFVEMAKDHDSAYVYFKKLTELKPDVFNYWNRLGISAAYLEKYSEAERAFLQAAKLDPSSRDVWINLAKNAFSSSKYPKTRTYAEKALKIKPNDGEAYLLIGQAYAEQVRSCVMKRGGWDKVTFDDRVVTRLAINTFKLAARDETVRSRAKELIASWKTLLPSREDLFVRHLNPGDTYKPKDACYSWINRVVKL
ncbi:MAG: tetratricopeptide repeat protein [Chlorobi bacterium]|nr:tetratricopeptide repeat protein [Chlorobiota bacterium]